MGWETGISLGATAVGGVINTENTLAQTKAMAQSADNSVANIANKTSRTEGSLETSFIRGGIALNGTGGPAAVFAQAAAQGNTDIQRTIDNTNSAISNTVNEGRSKTLNGIAQGFSKLGAGTISGAIGSAWNGLSGNLDPSPQGFDFQNEGQTGYVGEF